MSYGNIYYDRRKSKIYWSEYVEGRKKERSKDWVPDFWLQTPDHSDFTSEKGNHLKRIVAETWGERNELIKRYKVNSEIENSVEVCGSDLSPEVKFILETWPQDLTETPAVWTMFVDIECESEFGFPEAEEAKERINLITVYSSKNEKYTSFALRTDYSCDIKFEQTNREYRFCDSEEEMLINFIEFLDEERYEIFSGWHSGGFDIPYLINRTLRILDNVDLDRYNFILTDSETKKEERKLVDEGSKLWTELTEEIGQYSKEIKEIRKTLKWTKRFSPYRIVEKKIKMVKDRFTKELKPSMVYKIEGVTDYDYLELDRQFRQGKRDSYKLDNVAKDELGDEKLPYEGSIKDFYHNDWKKFVEYNIQDVKLVVDLNKKLNYIPQAIALSYKCHCQFEDNFGTVQKVESAIYNFLYKEKIILSDHGIRHASNEKISGAYVTPAGSLRRGFHHWIIDYDATSLYPSLMRGINISYDTKIGNIKASKNIFIVDDDENISVLFVNGGIKKMKAGQLKQLIKEQGYHVASNNVIFENIDRKKGVLVKILDMWFAQRKADKKIHDQYRKEAITIFDNCVEVENGHEVYDNDKTKKLSAEDYEKYTETMRLSGIHYNLQWACKILLNSVYGCLASSFFRYYDKDLGWAVTSSGQTVIKNTGKRLNDFFNDDIFKKKIIRENFKINNEIQKTETLLYQDTDSCIYSTTIRTNNGVFCIGDLFLMYKNKTGSNHLSQYGHEIVDVSDENLTCLTIDEKTNMAVHGTVKKLIRHKVTKKKWQITIGRKKVVVTEDHCVVVKRDGKLLRIKPSEINKNTDKIITIF